MKSLLNVRLTTCNELCLLELGLPRLVDYVKQKQYVYISRIIVERQGMLDDPLPVPAQ